MSDPHYAYLHDAGNTGHRSSDEISVLAQKYAAQVQQTQPAEGNQKNVFPQKSGRTAEKYAQNYRHGGHHVHHIKIRLYFDCQDNGYGCQDVHGVYIESCNGNGAQAVPGLSGHRSL